MQLTNYIYILYLLYLSISVNLPLLQAQYKGKLSVDGPTILFFFMEVYRNFPGGGAEFDASAK